MTYDTILTRVEHGVGLITLNRPEALNALNDRLTREVSAAVDAMEADEAVGALQRGTSGQFTPCLAERHETYRLDLWERR